MHDAYGYSDIEENETVTLRVAFNKSIGNLRSDVVFFSKVFAHATGRDSGARVGEDVAFAYMS